MNNPLVSICCTAYNHEQFITECLDGFLMQKTNFNFEILIHDDASTDGTQNIIKDYQQKHPNLIKPIFQTENQYSQGVKPFIKYLFPKAQGKYIALCEGDDYWIDCLKLQEQVDMLEKNQHLGLCFTDCELVNTENKVLKENLIPVKFQRELNQSDILSRFCPNTNTMLFRKGLIDKISFEKFKGVYNGDSFLFGFILQNYNAGYLPIKGGAYRVHEGGIWSQKKQEFKLEKSIDSCLTIIKTYRVNEPQLFENYVYSRFKKLYALRANLKIKQAFFLIWKYMVFKYIFFKAKKSYFI